MEVDGVSYDEAYIKLFHTSKNIDEFKTKYLELQQKYLVDFKNINSSQKNQKKTKKLSNLYKQKVKTKKLFKDDSIRNELVKKLLEGKFSTSKELELLFGMKFNDDAGEFNKILSQNTTSKNIDIKA